MKKILKSGLSLCFIGCFLVASSTMVSASDNGVEVPNYMQPDSILIYGNDLNYSFERGGEADSFNTKSSDIMASAGMKAVYDKNGLLRNVYYPVPGDSNSYQLRNPMAARKGSGVNDKGSGKYSYGNNCTLNFKSSEVVGTGQITYYGQPDNPNASKFIGDHNNTLKLGDCATKMYVDDIPTGVVVTASNQNSKNTTVLTFIKNDCGSLPNAILDIFEDGTWSKQGIRGLTVGNVKDSVDNGKISHKYEK